MGISPMKATKTDESIRLTYTGLNYCLLLIGEGELNIILNIIPKNRGKGFFFSRTTTYVAGARGGVTLLHSCAIQVSSDQYISVLMLLYIYVADAGVV